MEALAELSDQLGNPGTAKLLLEAKQRKIRVSRAHVESLVKRQGNRQLFQPLQPAKGTCASESSPARYQADLADLSTNTRNGFRYFLIAANVFTRQARAEPLTAKHQAKCRRC